MRGSPVSAASDTMEGVGMSYISRIDPWERRDSAGRWTPLAAWLMLLTGAVWLLVVAAVLTLLPRNTGEVMIRVLEAGA